MHLVQPADLPKPGRMAPGQRRQQILQVLATMLQEPQGERVTTAALAARLCLSEAALYRHFASKAQMFEGLIEFIESSLFGLAEQIGQLPQTAPERAQRLVWALLQFAQTNPGLARVLVGDALVLEHERLNARVHQLFERLESTLRQWLRESDPSASATVDAQARAAVLMGFAQGRLLRFVRSGFKRSPMDQFDAVRLHLPCT